MRPARPSACLLALALGAPLLGALTLAPSRARAQTGSTNAMSTRVVVVLPFRGAATQDLLDDAEAVVRNALMARGARVPDRTAVRSMLGVDAPRDATSMAGFGRSMSATHVLVGEVQPLSGQYNLTLTVVEVTSGRAASRTAAQWPVPSTSPATETPTWTRTSTSRSSPTRPGGSTASNCSPSG